MVKAMRCRRIGWGVAHRVEPNAREVEGRGGERAE